MFLELFSVKKPIIGVLHLKGDSRAGKLTRALVEADLYATNGVDAMVLENYFGTSEDVEAALCMLRHERPNYMLGVNLLNDFERSYRLCKQYDAPFMQVDSICGQLPPDEDEKYAEMILETRSSGNVAVIGGVRFKNQSYMSGRSVEEDLKLGVSRCDAIAVTGVDTGVETETEKILLFRNVIGDFPLVVSAGMTLSTVFDKLQIGDAAIVGSTFKDNRKDNGEVFGPFVREFMDEVKRLRISVEQESSYKNSLIGVTYEK